MKQPKTLSKSSFKTLTNGDLLQAFILFIIISIVPIIVKYAQVPTGPDEFNVLRFTDYVEDFFSYYKSNTLVFLSSILLIFHLYIFFTKKVFLDFNIKKMLKNPIHISTTLFITSIILSSIFSTYNYTVIHGISERYESMFILLSYVIIFYSVLYFVKSTFLAKLIYIFSLVSAIIIGIISVNQYFFTDIFTTNFGAKMLLGNYHIGQSVNLTLNGAYATLFNPNLLSQYSGMMLPITFIAALMLDKRDKLKYISFVTCLLMVVALIASGSKNGIAGILISLILGITLLIVYLFKNKSKYLIYVISVISSLSFLIVTLYLIPSINTKINSFFLRTLTVFDTKHDFSLTGVTLNMNTSSFEYNNQTINIVYNSESDEVLLFGNDGNLLVSSENVVEDFFTYYENVPNIGTIQIQRHDYIFAISIINSPYYLIYAINHDATLSLLDTQFQIIDIYKEIPSFGFAGFETFGSSRGYIWSRSFPILFDNLILGTGADTFSLVFPQDEINAKIKYFGNPYILIDKPHNLYLQTALNTGILSLIGILVLFAYYIINTINSLLNSFDNSKLLFALKLGLLLGNVSFMTSSMFSDSNVNVTPIFWALFGLGFAVNKFNFKNNLL